MRITLHWILTVIYSGYQDMIEIILFFGQHINCKSIVQPSVESVLVTLIAFPFWTTENLSGHSCPPNQFNLSTDSGHCKPFPIVIVLDFIPDPTLATKHSKNRWVS